jgi:hypothetical protein
VRLTYHLSVKSAVRGLIRHALSSESVWSALPERFRASEYLRVQRSAAIERRFWRQCEQIFKAKRVLAGPFRGMRYPNRKAIGSAIYPKLMGCYESELHRTVEHFLEKRPSLVIDIGHAEGYYLVGLGMRLSDAELIGYDIEEEARVVCLDLAEANGIAPERLRLMNDCSVESLSRWLPRPSLIICDCEGFEAKLFRPEAMSLWSDSDLIIEGHNFLIPGITEAISSRLTATHAVKVVPSIKAEEKMDWVSNDSFRDFRREHKLRLLEEGRPCAMGWIVAERR